MGYADNCDFNVSVFSSQDRTTLPLPVKRIVERSESSSADSSDEEANQRVAVQSNWQTPSLAVHFVFLSSVVCSVVNFFVIFEMSWYFC